MKNLFRFFVIITAMLSCYRSKAQIINIPDVNFKAKLLQANTVNLFAADSTGSYIKVDINNNNEIEQDEALSVYYLFVGSGNILSLEGISTFANIRVLGCSDNLLTSLNVSSLSNLQDLDCYRNQISTLNVSGLKNLQRLYCVDNKLTSLNVSGLNNLKYLSCNINKLVSIYMRNNTKNTSDIGVNYTFYENPNLRYVCIDDSDIAAIQNTLQFQGISGVSINTFCSSTLDGTHYTFNTHTPFDINNNGCTASDPIFPFLKIEFKNTTDSGYSICDAQGDLAIPIDIGTYTLTPQLQNNYFTCSPTSNTISIPEDTVSQQFCITPVGVKHDVSISIVPFSPARPGFSDATYKIILKNEGNQIEDCTVKFNYDESRQDYISASVIPIAESTGLLTFSESNLQIFEIREITVTMHTNAPTDNPAVNVGDELQLTVTATLDNDVRDVWSKDNLKNIKQTVTGSIDPNDKICLEGSIIAPATIGEDVHYVIRFENSGTANAENIVVTDYIDLAKFDISSFELTSTSHSCKTLISNGNKVQFLFDNINLPYTEPLKHGYVAFKIKTKNNLVIGDSLKNYADIYFDYNAPVTTNTATSRIDNVSSIKTHGGTSGSLSIYPNPGSGQFTINFESPCQQSIFIKIISIDGNVVYQKKINHSYKSQLRINENLQGGVYFITVNGEKEQYVQKLIVTR